GASQFASNTNDFPPTNLFNSLTFSGADYILNGNPISLNNGITNASGTNTLNLDVQINAHQAFRCSSGARLVVAGDIALANRTLTTAATGDIVLSGAISGTGGIIKTNAGTLTLTGGSPNTFTGATIVNQGALELARQESQSEGHL